ncbi:MAG: BatA domain-containing protein [Eubacteriales bacterium]|nr:BatA domain-containing protein [Eubacteriales bacterium]
MRFQSPAALILLIAIPGIILLYMLKQRFQEHQVSSIYLWNEVLKNIEANTPWQKLRKNILMVLQILAVAALALALANPYLTKAGGNAETVILAIDSTMSMQATDVKPSRFEAARKTASGIVSELYPGTEVIVVSIGRETVIEMNLSNDINTITDRINSLEVTNEITDKEASAAFLSSLLGQYPGAELKILGDEPLPLSGGNIEFIGFNGGGANYAIVNQSNLWTIDEVTALTVVANYSSDEALVPVSLFIDGEIFDSRDILIKPGENSNIYWHGIPSGTRSLECRLEAEDSLDADNIAWDAVVPRSIRKVLLVTEGNVYLENIFKIIPEVELVKSEPEAYGPEMKGYDLYVFDGTFPEELPEGSILCFNPSGEPGASGSPGTSGMPGSDLFEVEEQVTNPAFEKGEHTVLVHLDKLDFAIGLSGLITTPEWGEPVLKYGNKSLAFAGTYDNRRVAVFGFDLRNTDLPLKPEFPILISDTFDWLLPTHVSDIEKLLPGEELEFILNPAVTEAGVITPDGNEYAIAPPFPAKVFNETGQLGLYKLVQKTGSSDIEGYFAINAPALHESDLRTGRDGSGSSNEAGGDNGSGNSNEAGGVNGNSNGGENGRGNGLGNNGDTQGVANSPDTASPPGRTGGGTFLGFRLQELLLWLALALILTEWWFYTNAL